MVDLSVEFAGINLRNPIIAASATPTKDAKAMKKAVDAGFGGVVAKSLFGDRAAIGRRYPRPRFKLFGWREFPDYPKNNTEYFTLHSLEDCSAFDYEEYARDINEAKRLIGDDGVVIASISGSDFEEWEDLCAVVNGSEADMCEINISCPFAADMGFKIGAGAMTLAPQIIQIVKKNLSIPFSAKLSPQVPDLASLAKAAEASGADALTVQARLSGIMIDIDTARPIGWGSIGGYGGPYLLGYGLKGVSQVASQVKIPISGVLGVWSWKDIVRYIMVGATTVQSATAVILRGYGVVRRWLRGITDWMLEKSYESIHDLRRSALKDIVSTSEVVRGSERIHVSVDEDRCIGCGECQTSCFYDAVEMKDRRATIDQERCDICGLCLEKCPTKAISLEVSVEP
ncbi:MAG: 4Fe-4S binding protein [Candidatus Bathyarchaeota archaeon]|nr:4Fe-4S binding protein [Candidatus Bathyarchaeota archaeon]